MDKKIIKKLIKIKEKYPQNYIGSNPSIAFLIAIGNHSESLKKNYYHQKKAIDWFVSKNVTDLRHLPPQYEEVFPLKWQNDYLFNMILSLYQFGDLFDSICLQWKIDKDWKRSIRDIYHRCGCKKSGRNSILLFARDFLEIPSFVLDKSSKKTLIENNLPVDPIILIDNFLNIGVNPNKISRRICSPSMHDWSRY